MPMMHGSADAVPTSVCMPGFPAPVIGDAGLPRARADDS